MKIEISESLGYSYLRHVKQCWLVQANWKTSEHWGRHRDEAELEEMFEAVKERFDAAGGVFKKTKNAMQLLKQAEIDVVGVDLNGTVHAVEAAFHEDGLLYGGSTSETVNTVTKKLLRTMVVLNAYHPQETKFHICFASPKVNPSVASPLKSVFDRLESEYPEINWELIINHDFTDRLVRPTLAKARTVADTSELFARAARLLDLTGISRRHEAPTTTEKAGASEPYRDTSGLIHQIGVRKLQPIVRQLMRTLLEDWPTLLDDSEIRKLMDQEHCQKNVGLYLAGFPLLRRTGVGKKGSTTDVHDRYWAKVYSGQFYVCSQWWKEYHRSNAQALLRFVTNLVERSPAHPGTSALEKHQKALREFIG